MTSSSGCIPRHVAARTLNRTREIVFSGLARYGFLVAIFLLNACGAAGEVGPAIGFKPYLLPVKLTVTQSGVDIAGDRNIVTPLGLVSIGARIKLPAKEGDSIRVIIRDQKRGGIGLDDIYDVKAGGGSFEAVTNGTTVIRVTSEREVVIDITDARIESIEFRKVSPAAFEGNGQDSSRWSEHWQTLPFGYHSWLLARWAYDDSTIEKWYGAGFTIFLARLIVATLLAIIDFLLVMVFFFAGLFYLFGETARNVYYGFLAIFVLLMLLKTAWWRLLLPLRRGRW